MSRVDKTVSCFRNPLRGSFNNVPIALSVSVICCSEFSVALLPVYMETFFCEINEMKIKYFNCTYWRDSVDHTN